MPFWLRLMSERDGVLPFPSGDDDTATNHVIIAARVASLYVTTPMVERAQIERCTRAVLLEASQHSTRGRFTAVLRARWMWGAAAAAVLIVATMRGRPAALLVPQGAITRIDGGLAIRFDLRLPARAEEVAIVGDFNGWDERKTPMLKRSADGTWSARVALLPGRHVYAFVVDGDRWLVDPLAPQVPDSGYGPTNALVVEGATR